MNGFLEPQQTMMTSDERETLTRTLREIESLLLNAQQILSATCSPKDPCLKSLCRARVRVLFLLLHQCPNRLSTSEFLNYHSHSSILRRFLGPEVNR